MKLALFDIDGVLADDRHRVQFALDRDYANYFDAERMAADAVYPEGLQMVLDMWADGWIIGYLTGRREDRTDVTKLWLSAGGFPVGQVRHRMFTEEGIPLANLKRDYMLSIKPYFEEMILTEDDPEVVRLVQESFGVHYAQLCTWHVKEKSLIRAAKA